MNVLIIGSGGREHALAWKIAQSNKVSKVFVAPGNAGTQLENKVENINIAVENIDDLLIFAKENAIKLTVVGPEVPLVLGVVDEFTKQGLAIFGPTKAAAQLEGSKTFSKDFLFRHNIPTAAYASFTKVKPAVDYIRQQGCPIVIKADGLAAGKGVILADNEQQAIDAVEDMLAGNAFGDAGNRVVIEEFLYGEEASFIVMADGKNVLTLASSQDHKARDNGDQGPNTGGMGAYSPAPVVTDEISKKVIEQVIQPTIDGMAKEGADYTGFLYAGLMINPEGDIKVLEYNCRFGDPETQPIMMRLNSDLSELCLLAIEGELDKAHIDWDNRPTIGIVMAAGGYPNNYNKGDKISGLDSITDKNVKVFHAGTTTKDNQIYTSGGRVLCVVATDDSVEKARNRAYENVNKIQWSNAYFRNDIGYRAIERENDTIIDKKPTAS